MDILTQTDQQIAFEAASDIHEDWRKNNGEGPRIKPTRDGYESDINIPFSELLPEFQEMNIMMTQYVVKLLKMNNYTIDEMFYNIHEYWLELNPFAKNTNLDVPFNQLAVIEQDKDIRVYNIVLGYYLSIGDS